MKRCCIIRGGQNPTTRNTSLQVELDDSKALEFLAACSRKFEEILDAVRVLLCSSS